jgi:hypothetical protein
MSNQEHLKNKTGLITKSKNGEKADVTPSQIIPENDNVLHFTKG